MVLQFINKNGIQRHILPPKIDGNYWFFDDNDNDIALNIEAKNNEWVIKNDDLESNEEIKIEEYSFYNLKFKDGKELTLYCSPDYDNTFKHYIVNNLARITAGNFESNEIYIKDNSMSELSFSLIYEGGEWNVEKLDEKADLFVNNKLATKKRLYPGDIVFCMGLRIIIISNLILINNPKNTVTFNSKVLIPTALKELNYSDEDIKIEEEGEPLYKKDDFFLRSPRLKFSVDKASIKIDAPPAEVKEDKRPIALIIGPMLTMGMTSMVTAGTAIANMTQNDAKLTSVLPSLIISFAMLFTMLVWPIFSRRYDKKQKKKAEEVRKQKYGEYISKKQKQIEEIIESQKQNILNNNVTTDKCQSIILNKEKRLWERRIEDSDFLKIRIGTGIISADIDISYPEKSFSLEEDDLRTELDKLVSVSKDIANAPITASLTDKNIAAVVGANNLSDKFIQETILKIIALHSYVDLKIVLFTNEENKEKWEFLKILPHCWSNDKSRRFYSTNNSEMQQVSNYLEEILNSRRYKTSSSETEINDKDYHFYPTYYLIITDDLKLARNSKFFKDVLEQKINYGFSVLIKNDKLADLPNDCSLFIELDEKQSGMFENEVTPGKQKVFKADINSQIDLNACAKKLANIPVELSLHSTKLPKVVTFLEMFNVGRIEQLNILDRWKRNNPIQSLQAPVGVDESGELFNLDLHEKFHGPHGLIAGMTGSGKSEFIITYILSLAVNYHPDEVSLVLIDYKGGGLAGAFENASGGVKLPHLSGSITNLDTIEMRRSLVSIQSELKRRQRIFNEAREKSNESTIDIYKYQRLYREGVVTEPVPHLFIISDEFAELKLQQPEFMDQLISTARIGRSLGVHLILATQKPSGVVNDQIWSNSKFRVCLKVQDKSDSMEMLKRSEAAMLKNVGRFYLQVGYNELFALGQSAWTGSKYLPSDKIKKKVDMAVEIIDNTGYVLKHSDIKNKPITTDVKGEELTNIVKYLTDISKRERVGAKKLWLDRIPDEIYIEDLKEKYNYKRRENEINLVIGEYDDPANQKQGLLTLNLLEEGNTIIYGAAGSGKEMFITSVIYSLITNHSAKETNIYILDFGAETLKNFREAPQVADVITINDEEKITNLFKLLKAKIEERKKLFMNFNGNYNFYNKKSGKKIPAILVVFNYFEAFTETYPDYEDEILQLLREGSKYGIIFMVSVSGSTSIRYRLLQSFKREYVLQLNEESDYRSILGNLNGASVSKAKGRGLVKLDEIFEFQTAYPYDKNNLSDYIKIVSQKLNELSESSVEAVPTLPEKVNEDFLNGNINDISKLPIGVEKSSLETSFYNFKTKHTTLISSQDITNTKKLVSSLIYMTNKNQNIDTIVIDASEIIDNNQIKIPSFYNNNFDEIATKICNTINKYSEEANKKALDKYKHIVCYIVGAKKFIDKLSSEEQELFEKTIVKNKELNKISFVLVDSIDNFKKCEYDDWYKENITASEGIWVGDGVVDQLTMKISRTTREMREEIGNDFGYVIKNSKANLIKLLDFDISKTTSYEIESL